MSLTVSRRAFAQGTAWSAPAILATTAIPAYAASQEELRYYYAQSQAGNIYYNHIDRRYYSRVWTTQPVGPERPGFTIGYERDLGEDTVATLDRLDYYIAIPSGLDEGRMAVRIDDSVANRMWSAPVRVYDSTLTLSEQQGGGEVSTAGYNVYKMSFLGSKRQWVGHENQTDTWAFSPVLLEFFSSRIPYGSDHFIGGYVTSFTLDNGYKRENRSLISYQDFKREF